MACSSEQKYLQLLTFVLANGQNRVDRTQVGTISYFGVQTRYQITSSFPLLTTKKMGFKTIVRELLWFLSGGTNITPLVKANIHIWDAWPYQRYRNSSAYQQETQAEFITKIKTNHRFAKKWGDLGPVYGKQWRNFNGVDQIKNLIHNLKTNPFSRRHIISAWNPAAINNMLLPPCHILMQFYVSPDRQLSCHLYQRSGDLFLGVPFNIASYSLLTMMIAQVCHFQVGEFIHTIGDAHIYQNHISQVKAQCQRTPFSSPKITINPQISSIFGFQVTDFKLTNYQSYPAIKAAVAV